VWVALRLTAVTTPAPAIARRPQLV